MIKIIIGIICVVGLIIYYLVIDRKSLHQKIESSISNFDEEQKLYHEKKTEQIYLSQDEKIELSWQFLYYIADIVLKKFSKQDRDTVHDIGTKLVETGMVYNHVIEYELEGKKNFAKAIAEKKERKSQRKKSV